MEELLRQAFQLGQQWVQDMNDCKEPTNFNEWYASDEVQDQVKNRFHTYNRYKLLIDFCSSVECYQINTDQVKLADGVDKYLKSIITVRSFA